MNVFAPWLRAQLPNFVCIRHTKSSYKKVSSMSYHSRYNQNHYGSSSNSRGRGGYKPNNSSLRTYYHYTDARGAQGIQETGMICASKDSGNDAMYGEGVYLNKMPPQRYSKTTIAENNYDGNTSYFTRRMDDGKVDYCVKMRLPKSDVVRVDYERDVHLHQGDIDLTDVPNTLMKVSMF